MAPEVAKAPVAVDQWMVPPWNAWKQPPPSRPQDSLPVG